MSIRKAILKDIETIEFCVIEAYSKYIPRIGKKPASMNTDFKPLINNGLVWVLEYKNKVIGLVVLVTDQEFVEISSLTILPDYQKMGFGKKLMKFCENYALENGFGICRLYTNSAIPELISYYENLGYIEQKRELTNGYNRVFMTKDLHSAI